MTAVARVSRIAAVWTVSYAPYRFYYAVGGTIGMPGTPESMAQWRRINVIDAAILFASAAAATLEARQP